MLAPKLRFKEFNDEWDYKLFNEIFEFIQNNSFSRDMLNYDENSKIYNIHYGDILTKYGEIIDFNIISNIVPKINNDISVSKFENKSYLKNGDIIIADTAEDLTVGKSCEVVNLHCKALAGLHTIPCRPKFKFASQYLGEYINSTSYHSQLIPYITGIKVSSISKTSIIKTKIYFPTVKEQEKISELFSLLNKKIELQQRKIEVLKMYKKGLTKKLLDYSNYKKVKLKDICTFYSGGTPDSKNKNFYTGNIPFIRSGEIHNETTELYITSEAIKNSSAKMVYKGSVLYALYGATSGDVSISKINGAINQAILCINGNNSINNCFLAIYLAFYRNIIINTYLQGGQGNLSADIIKNLIINLPSVEEQTEIVQYINSIDKKLYTENEKLKNLNFFKKYLLQQMFI